MKSSIGANRCFGCQRCTRMHFGRRVYFVGRAIVSAARHRETDAKQHDDTHTYIRVWNEKHREFKSAEKITNAIERRHRRRRHRRSADRQIFLCAITTIDTRTRGTIREIRRRKTQSGNRIALVCTRRNDGGNGINVSIHVVAKPSLREPWEMYAGSPDSVYYWRLGTDRDEEIHCLLARSSALCVYVIFITLTSRWHLVFGMRSSVDTPKWYTVNNNAALKFIVIGSLIFPLASPFIKSCLSYTRSA